MPMRETYPQRAVRHDPRERQVRRLDIEVALDDLQLRRDAAQELVRLFVREIAQAEHRAYLAGREELLELLLREPREFAACWMGSLPSLGCPVFNRELCGAKSAADVTHRRSVRYEEITQA